MAKISDAEISSLLFDDQASAPTTPASGFSRIYTKSDGLYVVDDAGSVTGPLVDASATPGAEGWEEVMTDLTANLVHRWLFDEASGNFVDEVASLALVPSGSPTYQQTSPISSFSARFASGAIADTASMGSIPVGAAARTIVAVYKADEASGQQTMYSYGTNGTANLWWGLTFGSGSAVNRISTAVWTNDLNIGDLAGLDGQWHLTATGFSGTRQVYLYHDGALYAKYLAAALNTGSSAPFRVGGEDFGSSNKFTGNVADLSVFSSWIGKPALDRLWMALRLAISS